MLSRSAAQQLTHWARIGRAFESAPGVDQRVVEAVLAGSIEYDAADDFAQAVVRAAWDQGIADRIGRLDLVAKLAQTQVGWVEADPDGQVIEHHSASRALAGQ